jgi:hypothetical protein
VEPLLVIAAHLTSAVHPLNSAGLAHGQILNSLNGIKMQSITKQVVFIAFFKLETLNEK